MINVYFSDAYVRSEHSFDTTRKSKWVAESLIDQPIRDIKLKEPCGLLTEKEILRTHAQEYLEALKTGTPKELAESQELPWCKNLLPMVMASNSGVLESALAALEYGVSGSLSSGLHHARRNRGAGYCTLNGLAIAVNYLLTKKFAKSILILDFDAHCGGGTHSLIKDNLNVKQIDVSVDADLEDFYMGTETNILKIVKESKDYLPTIYSELDKINAKDFDLCIYNAGMDPYEGCVVGGLKGINENILKEREDYVFSWCKKKNLPVCFVLAGGYTGPFLTKEKLISLHRHTLTSASKYI